MKINDALDEVLKNNQEKFFPMSLPDNVTAKRVNSDELFQVFNKHINDVFPDGSFSEVSLSEGRKNRATKLAPLKNRYNLLHSEYILFFNKANIPIGWMFGETEAQITFYMRNTGFLKEYQNKGIYTAFLKVFLEYLRNIGYEKVTSHHLGTNRAVLIPKLKLGFDICGLELHEVFGANVKLSYIFHDDRKGVYHRKYGK